MNITPIRTEADYRYALAQASLWFGKEPEQGSADADALTALLAMIEAHEAEHVPIDLPPRWKPSAFAWSSRG